MKNYFKALVHATVLAAATALTSGSVFAAYNYNAQITVVAPKGSTAEAAAKNKTLPVGVKHSTCAPEISNGSAITRNPDYLQIVVKYDAGKLANEIGDVYLVLQDLSVSAAMTGTRYIAISRPTNAASFNPALNTTLSLTPAATAEMLDGMNSVLPFLATRDNLGSGAQTETLFGGSIGLFGLNKGLWAATVIIANPGAISKPIADPTTDTPANTFMFSRPETWAAHDTVVFELGTPFDYNAAALLKDEVGLSTTCE